MGLRSPPEAHPPPESLARRTGESAACASKAWAAEPEEKIPNVTDDPNYPVYKPL